MEHVSQHIIKWMGVMTMLLLTLCSCGSEKQETVTGDPVLTFYVYAPDRPIPTRAAQIDPLTRESDIHSLQIWVFESGTNTLVGYLQPNEMPTTAGKVYQMKVSEAFAYAVTRPHVDVYVVANMAAVDLTLTEETDRTTLENTVIGGNYFIPQKEVTEKGLPMSGVLRDQTVVGDNPILRIGDYANMAKVKLTRDVSKVRFVFCKATGTELSIKSLQIDGNMIPTTEYVFLGTDGNNYHVGNSYVPNAISLSETIADGDVKSCDSPATYAYVSQDAQDYENLIDQGVREGKLTQRGPYYFRETDKKLSGVLKYQIGDNAVSEVTFSTAASGSFARNHSWIVYAYYESGDFLQLNTLYVKNWENLIEEHNVYNW